MIEFDENLKKEIDALTEKDVSREVSYAFEHELMWYGIDALTQVHVMSRLKEAANARGAFESLVEKYGIAKRVLDEWLPMIKTLSVPLESIQKDGIFIPTHAYSGSRIIPLMWGDYGNRVSGDDWPSDREVAANLIGRSRRLEVGDLQNLDLINGILQFGKDMWTTCVRGFREYAPGFPATKMPKQPKRVTDLGEKLIEYYSEIIKEDS